MGSIAMRGMGGCFSDRHAQPATPLQPACCRLFILFVLIVGVVLLNVVVAELLDKFLRSIQRHEDEDQELRTH